MDLSLPLSAIISGSTIRVTGSKSETNRLLLLQALYPNLSLKNTSNSDDSQVMQNGLESISHPSSNVQHPTPSIQHPSPNNQINVHHAGTAMRFLTAYFSIQEGNEVVLTGSSRMKERPIKILVDALRQLGAEINYEENDGFPPIKISGKKLRQSNVSLPANVSSQYISALLLIAPKLENGLELTLEGEITSVPYINMTLALLNEIGVETSFVENKITVKPLAAPSAVAGSYRLSLTVESDWSSASYFYSLIALSEIGTKITLSSYKKHSFQGDSVLAEIYKEFGVETIYDNDFIHLTKTDSRQPATVNQQLNNAPDIAQTIAVTCFGLGTACHLTGLHTLKIKETDRLTALKTELEKLGATVAITEDSISLEASSGIHSGIKIKTYQDHRMAMAFAPLALKTAITIEDAEVVSKSYPAFWDDLKSIGVQIAETR